MSEDLSWEVEVDAKGSIDIPAVYVERSGIPEGESFSIAVGRKGFRLRAEGKPAVGWGDHYEERESDGTTILKYLSETNTYNRNHRIVEEYTRLGDFCEGEKFEVKVGEGSIRLILIK